MDENVHRNDGSDDEVPARSDWNQSAAAEAGIAAVAEPGSRPHLASGAGAEGGPYSTPAGVPPTAWNFSGAGPRQLQPDVPWPPQASEGVAAATTPRRRRGRTAAVAGAAAVALAAGGAVVGHDVLGPSTTAGSGTAAGSAATGQPGTGTFGDRFAPGTFGNGNGSTGNGSTGSGATSTTTRSATATESVGIVDITTVLDYGEGAAAGTGIVLTANGEILTNNHVVAGATKITVTLVSTGTSYTATVVGTDATDDVAVLQPANASGLSTATLLSTATTVGAAVTAVGNAGGTGGTPTAATGTVLALGQSITATDDSGADAEQLTGLIEVDAAIEAGDSGGPLYSSSGSVIGIDTAASSAGPTVGFAIPIATATAIADRIEAGEDSATIQQSTPAFLGVQFAAGSTGAIISGVVDGSPAATAGLAAGDTITAVGRTAVSTAEALSTALDKHDAGDSIRITWTDTAGDSHTATVTRVAGPAA